MRATTMTYTTKRMTIESFTEVEQLFLIEASCKLNKAYGNKYNWTDFKIHEFIKTQYLNICYRDQIPVGLMAASLFRSFFDPECIILKQNLLYSKPGSRAAYWLMKDFIDFGKANANHVITMIGSESNIKPSSLEKLGFEKLEELYRLEV